MKKEFETIDSKLDHRKSIANSRYSTKKRMLSASNDWSQHNKSRQTQATTMNSYQPKKKVLNNLLLTMRCRSDLNSISASTNA